MKNIKFKVVSVLLSASLFIPAVTANAASPSGGSNLGAGLIKQQQNIANRQEWQQYKTTIGPKRDTIKQNSQANASLRKDVAGKRATIKGLIKDITQNHKQLTADDLSKVEAQLKVVNDDINSLKSTNDPVKNDYQSIKDDVKNKNFQDAESKLDDIISIQNTRTTDLNKISADMDTLISLLQTASANRKSV